MAEYDKNKMAVCGVRSSGLLINESRNHNAIMMSSIALIQLTL